MQNYSQVLLLVLYDKRGFNTILRPDTACQRRSLTLSEMPNDAIE
jgi:hypothetical protein